MKNFKTALFLVSITILFTFTAVNAQTPSALETLKKTISANIFIEVPLPSPKSSSSYLKAANKLSGEELFQYLHKQTEPSIKKGIFKYSYIFENIIPSKSGNPAEYTESQKCALFSGYTDAKSYMYSKSSNITCNGKPGIITLYSQVCANGKSGNGYDYNEFGDANGDKTWNDEVNTEHIWPQSFFREKYPMRADLHQLYPTFTKPNGMRSNYSFAIISKPSYSTSAGSKQSGNRFEPADSAKGNVARAMLYFMVRYYDKSIRNKVDYNDFWVKRVPMFLEWNKQDPPDANEIRRNNLIEKYQSNRNPFIDDPSLADKIGAAVFQSH